jgi:hypothetical protein
MIKFIFDRRSSFGFLPNLIKDSTLVRGSKEWWDLAITPPFSYEFRFLNYCSHEGIATSCTTLEEWDGEGSAYYPVNINFFDPHIDYFELMDKGSYQALVNGKIKFLFYYSEGDDPYEFMTSRIKKLCMHHMIHKTNVQVVTANWYSRRLKNYHYFPDDEVYYKYLQTVNKEVNYVTDINLSPREKAYTCLIRADKLWRKGFAYNLYSMDHPRYLSYLNYKYETSNQDDDWSGLSERDKSALVSFELKLPLRCDETTDSEANNHKLINKKFYDNSYWNFIVETHFGQSHTTFLTEKTFKPILNLQPFIIIGSPESLSLLKYLGYQTFSHVINEQYDGIKDTSSRMSKLIKLCYTIGNLSDEKQIEMIKLTASQVRHNQNKLLESKADRINELLSGLEYA